MAPCTPMNKIGGSSDTPGEPARRRASGRDGCVHGFVPAVSDRPGTGRFAPTHATVAPMNKIGGSSNVPGEAPYRRAKRIALLPHEGKLPEDRSARNMVSPGSISARQAMPEMGCLAPCTTPGGAPNRAHWRDPRVWATGGRVTHEVAGDVCTALRFPQPLIRVQTLGIANGSSRSLVHVPYASWH